MLYHLFVGMDYYPFGGVRDWFGTYDDIRDAQASISEIQQVDWAQIATFDGTCWTIVEEWSVHIEYADSFPEGRHIGRWRAVNVQPERLPTFGS